MDILVNGNSLALEARPGATLGEVLSQADALVEKSGAIIVGIKIDGADLGPAGYGEASRRAVETVASLDIRAERARDVRIRTIATLLELVELSARAAETEEAGPGDWRSLREGAADIRDAFGGLFAADELAFVNLLSETLGAAGDEPDAAAKASVAAQASRIASFFGERMAELNDPVAEMRAAAVLFESRSRELADLPVLLQTGRDGEAMKTVLYFIEVFNKVIRVMPELAGAGVDTGVLRIGGSSVAQFYGEFNGILRELTDAFEHKDAILIGDLAEYEILPRMRTFFAAMDGALPS
jgi:hypothetical protein